MRPGLSTPAGSNAAFSRWCSASMAGDSGWNTSSPALRAAEQRRVAAGRGRGVPDRARRAAVRAQPDLRRRPSPRPPPRRPPGSARSAAARAARAASSPARPGGACRGPRPRTPAARPRRRAPPPAPPTPASPPAEAQVQPRAVVERAAERRRPAHQLGEPRPRGVRVQLEAPAPTLGAGAGRHPQRHLQDHAQAAQRAGHQAEGVEAGDVLEHLAAEAQRLAARRRGWSRPARSRAPPRRTAAGAREPGRHHAADGAGRARSRGGSNASRWPHCASRASISASGVPARAVTTSSLGS